VGHRGVAQNLTTIFVTGSEKLENFLMLILNFEKI
jgi:hypothetical protein